jgi:hypothetical protein
VPVVAVGVDIAIAAMGANARRRVKETSVILAAIAVFPRRQQHFGFVLIYGSTMACGDVGVHGNTWVYIRVAVEGGYANGMN